ncbi:MAG TPA: nickel-binding protein [candidate division Zixibacteria bacterium]|nr:nickel-binding protein [candidate division Zixibacteria bacterium]
MDRHYVEGASRLAMETAHRQDLEIMDDFDVNIMTYWFDEARSTAFCLAEAPSGDALRDLHAHSHGFVPNEVTEVDPITVQAFLGRIEDPVAETGSEKEAEQGGVESAFRSIMFTDLKDSTQISVQLGDKKAMHLLRVHNAMTREALRANNGREIKTTGDGFMLSFVNASDALNCAVEIQESFKDYNEQNPEEKLYVRIGVAAGEPIEEKGDLYGAAVNMASRICSQAKAGGVLVAQVFRDEIRDDAEHLKFASGGKLSLKGFDQLVEVYEVIWE